MGDSDSISWRGRIRLVDEVAQVLRERIYAGAYEPGAALRQEQLAADLQVSRTPLREALRVLEREGLLTAEPGRGVRVVAIDHETLLDAYAVREVLDGLAARLAALRATRADVAELEEMLERQHTFTDASGSFDVGGYTQANVAFHARIVDLADNDFVTGQLPLVPLTSQVFVPKRLIAEDRARSAVAEHELIVAAIAKGDGAQAEEQARQHIRVTIDGLLRTREQQAERVPSTP
ncbi:GntR family transcriptional regulator [Patulibacter americanus]|uniref:GntR family transcriptional regulator n=1 Tax=Patulibacter americanus TaxID=588672 RepID=UPI0003B5396A|nr:GntR family transcriptional regulator [Patulibacter americanus]